METVVTEVSQLYLNPNQALQLLNKMAWLLMAASSKIIGETQWQRATAGIISWFFFKSEGICSFLCRRWWCCSETGGGWARPTQCAAVEVNGDGERKAKMRWGRWGGEGLRIACRQEIFSWVTTHFYYSMLYCFTLCVWKCEISAAIFCKCANIHGNT